MDKPKKIRQRAVALGYDAQKDFAPRVLAKGAGEVAERIIDIARKHGVQVHQDPDLVAVLSTLDVATRIPPELYRAVAEVLAFVYRVNQRVGR